MTIFNLNNKEDVLNLINKYGKTENPLFGETENGKPVELSIFDDCIVTKTTMNDGWMQIVIYNADGTCEETFEEV